MREYLLPRPYVVFMRTPHACLPVPNDWSRLSFQSRLCLNETIHFIIDSGMYRRLLDYAI